MNKLVRDKIPEIIESQGKIATTKIAKNEEEYYKYLKNKLLEEVNEFIEATESKHIIEELADVLEVLDAIYDFNKIDKKIIQEVKTKKFNERGGFKKKIILLDINDTKNAIS